MDFPDTMLLNKKYPGNLHVSRVSSTRLKNSRLFLFVTVAEFINSTCSINQLHFTGIERVRGV